MDELYRHVTSTFGALKSLETFGFEENPMISHIWGDVPSHDSHQLLQFLLRFGRLSDIVRSGTGTHDSESEKLRVLVILQPVLVLLDADSGHIISVWHTDHWKISARPSATTLEISRRNETKATPVSLVFDSEKSRQEWEILLSSS